MENVNLVGFPVNFNFANALHDKLGFWMILAEYVLFFSNIR